MLDPCCCEFVSTEQKSYSLFPGMSFCLPLAYWQESVKKKAQREENEPLLGESVRDLVGIMINSQELMWNESTYVADIDAGSY